MNEHPTYDVAVIGYGPTGATAANLLGRLGLDVVVIERTACSVRASHGFRTYSPWTPRTDVEFLEGER